MDTLSLTREEYLKFKDAYNAAVKSEKDIFEFKGHQFLIGYAKYFIEYLDRKFKK